MEKYLRGRGAWGAQCRLSIFSTLLCRLLAYPPTPPPTLSSIEARGVLTRMFVTRLYLGARASRCVRSTGVFTSSYSSLCANTSHCGLHTLSHYRGVVVEEGRAPHVRVM